jgi:hypothetical protein
VTASRLLILSVAVAGAAVLAPARADAQWWRSTPRDFEECADVAEKAKTKEDRSSQLGDCNVKFAGRRKPGGGYTYFDFMQNRNFDIAGPNPTAEEQKKIDEEYVAYLERERRNTAAAALNAKRQEQQQLQQAPPPQQQAALQSNEKIPVPVASPAKQPARAEQPKTRSLGGSAANCPKGTFSCDWPRLSDSINDLKRLFGATPSTPTNTKGKKG